ncbi:MAG: 6-carboxytetrahydropterin synthase [Nitrososphaerota archaeon]
MPHSEKLVKIRLEEGSLNFDYAHFLPAIEKCSTIHGHTASLSIEAGGEKVGPGLVVDFGLLKRIAREVVSVVDHKIIVCERYIESAADGRVTIRFSGKGGEYLVVAPQSEVFIAPFESTIENITAYIAESIMRRMPENVVYVKVVASEGVGKSAESVIHREGHV